MDTTGLEGKYHVVVDYAQSDVAVAKMASGLTPPGGDQILFAGFDAPFASVIAAIDKLGLKLETRKITVEQFVIDHVEKMPTEN